ncbi:hypothetical protein [Streptomyces halobius]|uniref:Uncharacterized protein n=1 Tax=Streptomyces halobius TaxID=2879846 RepID=A0ABY4M303_9ACTN|nr:hypothetical protein [Streptomyces halobius]UQA92127.1 hypothetical protein K9S39_09970 [Streptomyces halobius]
MSNPGDRGKHLYTHVLLKAEYVATPLWDRTPGRINDSIDYDELGLSDELAQQLEAWNYRFSSAAFESDDPSEREAFTEDGSNLAAELQEELGDGVEVIYVDGIHGVPTRPNQIVSESPGDYHWSAE